MADGLLALPSISIDEAHIFDDVMRFDHRHAEQPRGRVMTVHEAAAELGVSVDDVVAGRHPRLPTPAATFDQLAEPTPAPGTTLRQAGVFDELSDRGNYPSASRPGVDEDRQKLHERIETYAADHGCSYTQAFHAIELADRRGT